MTSSPESASGRVSAWMSKVRSMPEAESARTISGWTPSSAKVGLVDDAAAVSGAVPVACSVVVSSLRSMSNRLSHTSAHSRGTRG
ncbi:hypothetical protein [Saccharomonospora sp. NB11]|jgi:hypothetical protein|uniref:hypothetical protein n=1 Tax=Saccharomonospora sp. NB11 TaxID=1642298 RepID=UPI0018D05D41|nr:hypothetical protein [Saccharomonospora sp. NB11]